MARSPLMSSEATQVSAQADRILVNDRVKLFSTSSASRRRLRQTTISVVVLIAAIGVWWILSVVKVFPSYALPDPPAVWTSFISLMNHGYGGTTFAADLSASLYRIALGFLLAAVIGIPIGLAMGRVRWIFEVIDPFLEFFRPVPPLAYIPLLVVWFGIGESPKVILIAAGTMPIIIINALSGVRSIPPVRLRVAQSLGATKWQMFYRVILPSALPEIFTGLRVANGVAWTCLVAAELVAANSGLGWLVEAAGQNLQVAIVIVGIIFIGACGYATELIVRLLERILVPWKGKS